MQNIWWYSVISVLAVSGVSLLGIFVFFVEENRLRKAIDILVALSAGALLGDAFLHLIPDIFSEISNPALAGASVLLGIIFFFVFEKFLRWGHNHHLENNHSEIEHDEKNCPLASPVGYLSLTSDCFHNFLDGIIIAVSYLLGFKIGLATTLAVFLHEIPKEIGGVAILLHCGFSKKKAVGFNILAGTLSLLGAVIALIIGPASASFINFIIPIAAGGFIYIASSDLVPELHKTVGVKNSLFQFGAILIGVGLMILLLFIEF
jgi:zinc and cadmium transporter